MISSKQQKHKGLAWHRPHSATNSTAKTDSSKPPLPLCVSFSLNRRGQPIDIYRAEGIKFAYASSGNGGKAHVEDGDSMFIGMVQDSVIYPP